MPDAPHQPPKFPERVGSPASAAGCLARGRGVFLLLSSIAVAAAGYVALLLLQGNLSREPELFKDVHPFARWMIEHRAWLALAALPPLLISFWIIIKPADKISARYATPWIAVGICTLWLLAMFAAVLAAFIMCMTPLYTYQEL